MPMEENILRLALQKSGRLSEDSLQLVHECGIRLDRSSRLLKARAYNFPAEVLYLRDDDIPEYVSNGIADIGIVGENVIVEKNRPVEVVERLGFSRCRLSIAVPNSVDYRSPAALDGLNIATSYPFTLAAFLKEHEINAQIKQLGGSVEIAPGIGLAGAICDIVSSGSTLLSNGLKEVEVVLESEAVLVQNGDLPKAKQPLLDQFLFRLSAVLQARSLKYILLNAPDAAIPRVIELLPGLRSPTVIPLAEDGWSSVHAVISESGFWDIIEQLKEIGAEGILVAPVEKLLP